MKDLSEEEKRIVAEVMQGPFWPLFTQFVESRLSELKDAGDSALTSDIPSILIREQYIGACKHLKYITADFQNYIKNQNQQEQ